MIRDFSLVFLLLISDRRNLHRDSRRDTEQNVPCMTNLFTPLTHIRETRQSTRMALTIPFAKKNCYATSFAVSGAIMWDDLHPQLRTITCLTSFKRELRKTLC